MQNSFSLSIEEIQNYYLKKPFLKKMYHYYVNNGYYNIISKQIVFILNNTFILLYSLFLFRCINWHKLLTMTEKTLLNEIVDMSQLFRLSLYNWSLVLSFIFFIVCKLIELCVDVVKYKYVKYFYNTVLNITDQELVTLKWEHVIDKFKLLYGTDDINIFYINNKITIKDNYFITLFDKNILKIEHLTPLMEWNIFYCFIGPIFDSECRYKNDFLFINDKFIKIVKNKIRTVAIANFIFMPLLLPFLILRNLFNYGEKFYNKPELLSSRHWTHNAKWKFRNYNELYHEFHDKLINSMKVANEYSNQFPIRIIGTFAELIVFILSSFFIMLVFATIINDGVLLHLYITSNKNVIWFMGIFATLIAIMRTIIKDRIIYYPDVKLKELKIILNTIDETHIKNKRHNDYFFNMYQYHIVSLAKDILHTVMVPFHLYELSFDTDKTMTYLSGITINSGRIGHTNKFAIFSRQETDRRSCLSKETFHLNNEAY
jgi:autophagy-related protein 9